MSVRRTVDKYMRLDEILRSYESSIIAIVISIAFFTVIFLFRAQYLKSQSQALIFDIFFYKLDL